MASHFPPIPREMVAFGGEDRNPAVQVFGRRFFADQTVTELLVELLLVATSAKHVGQERVTGDAVLPDIERLRSWPNEEPLLYAAKARLNLKLFAFLGASKLETRHQSHREHYHDLLGRLSAAIQVAQPGQCSKEEVLKTLENLFLGFQGIGGQRTWCAQAFIPFARDVIAAETIWNETQARRDGVVEWEDVLVGFQKYFSLSRHRFLARGGELLYLQICNALRTDEASLSTWLTEVQSGLLPEEATPEALHAEFVQAVNGVVDNCPDAVGELARFVDSGVEPMTSSASDKEHSMPHLTRCGWCPGDSWPEATLFMLHFTRVCKAQIDPVERLQLLEIVCGLQVLRTLSAHSSRLVNSGEQGTEQDTLGYIWALSDPDGSSKIAKLISSRSVQANQRIIREALRHPEIIKVLEDQRKSDEGPPKPRPWKDPYREADTRYGHKLFLSLAKRMGLVVPKRGPGARMVLNDRLLRCMVLSLVPPGARVTYDTFKQLMRLQFGMVVDDDGLCDACSWSGTQRLSTLGGDTDYWLVSMLDAAGMYVRLSDSCSLVRNPFSSEGGAP